MIVTGSAAMPWSVKWAAVGCTASSCGVKDRSPPSSVLDAAGSGPKTRSSPMQTGAPVPLVTVRRAYRAWPSLPSKLRYIGLPGSTASSREETTVCHWPAWLASSTEALAEGSLGARVMPTPFSSRTWPRSMVRLSCQVFGHHDVAASPSIAFAAALPDCTDVALACPDRAQLTLRGAGRC